MYVEAARTIAATQQLVNFCDAKKDIPVKSSKKKEKRTTGAGREKGFA